MGCCRTFAARCESFSPCQDADTNHSRFLQSCGAMPNLGYKPLNRTWAKLEILFGLTAAGIGLLLGNWAPHADPERMLLLLGGALALFVLGSYLAMAGHRSHLYQSLNEQTKLLQQAIHHLNDKGISE